MSIKHGFENHDGNPVPGRFLLILLELREGFFLLVPDLVVCVTASYSSSDRDRVRADFDFGLRMGVDVVEPVGILIGTRL